MEKATVKVERKQENTRFNRSKRSNNSNKWKIGIGAIVVVGVLVFAGINHYQATRFNPRITINGTKVGGLTADKAIKKLGTTVLKNEVYVGKEQIFNGNDTKMGFSNKDLPNVQKLLKKQRTIFPSLKAQNYTLMPSEENQYRSQTLKELVRKKLINMNKNLEAPKDAQAKLEQGEIVVSKSRNGKQYDVSKLLQDYENQEYKSNIYLKPVYIQPIKEDSPIVKKEKNLLQEIVQRTVHYTVQNKTYTLNGRDVIKKATASKNGQVKIDPTPIKNEIAKINVSQSTLNKTFRFKTHSGSVISVKGQTYGWALDVEKETKRIQEAFEKGRSEIKAEKIYGVGWSTYGTGYHATTNNGIGDTYAEVSIKEQRIWIYKDGQLKVTTNVVTGKHSTHEDTNPGVWYVMYKASPYTLRGSEVGNPNYSVKVQYWAPFTLGGQGFHDAGWRRNWSSSAYLQQGSGGCVNIAPSVMKTVYENLVKDEPVVIY